MRHNRWILFTLGSLLIAVLYVVFLRFWVDPRPLGPLQQQRRLANRVIPSGETTLEWLDMQIPADEYSVRLTAAYVCGENDILTGLALGTPADYLSVAVSPLGYTAVTHTAAGRPEPAALFAYAPFPHVRGGTQANEIWLDVRAQAVTVRLNRELLWHGSVNLKGKQIGLVGQSFGTAAVVRYDSLHLFYAPPS